MTWDCQSCGNKNLDGSAAFCSSCGHRVSRGTTDAIFERRASTKPGIAQEALNELRLIGIRNLLPYKDWLADKTWNLLWVRWFLGIALFPLLLFYWASSARLEFQSVAFLFGIYFALMWAVVLYFMLLPRLLFGRIAKVALFTMTVGITLVLLLQQLPFVSSLYSATNSASIVGRLIGFVFGVGVVEEIIKVLPVWWLYVHKRNEDSLSTKVFLGCISGFAFGVAEAVNYSLSYAFGLRLGSLGSGDYLILQLTRLITLPLLHAVWAGVFAYFVALASVNLKVGKGLLVAGLLITAILHGLYDTVSESAVGLGVAVLSILLFLAYYRSGQTLQAKISSIIGLQRAEDIGAVTEGGVRIETVPSTAI